MKKLTFLFIVIMNCVGSSFSQIVKIGNQQWNVKNLTVNTFRNGDLIPEVNSEEDLIKASENRQPAWCYYNYDPILGGHFGKLYNWYAVNDPRGLAPKGWHIPCQQEWDTLISFLGGHQLANMKMKSTYGWIEFPIVGEPKICEECSNWSEEKRKDILCLNCYNARTIKQSLNMKPGSASDSSVFSALPAGFCTDGEFDGLGAWATWWSSSNVDADIAWSISIINSFSIVLPQNSYKNLFYSVCCLKD